MDGRHDKGFARGGWITIMREAKRVSRGGSQTAGDQFIMGALMCRQRLVPEAHALWTKSFSLHQRRVLLSLYQYGGSGGKLEVTPGQTRGYAGSNGTGGASSIGVVKNQPPRGGKPDTFEGTGARAPRTFFPTCDV